MTPEELHLILDAVRSGATTVDHAAARIGGSTGYIDLDGIKVDVDREHRRGFPEVIYCESKRVEEIVAIVLTLLENHGLAFGTRCPPATAEEVLKQVQGGEYDPIARTIRFGEPRPSRSAITTAVVAAGTSDRPVAEEVCRTLETFGVGHDRVYDVGVAGLHRLLDQRERIGRAGVLIVVAGMEGALPSVVTGLYRQPIIAVPTSVGYGTAFGGLTALFSMLTSCSSGMSVVNIDNGFGAAMAALSIINAIEAERGK
jgi:pyridinium-3,5-biscarboxylic acid mononucleotide synthase